MYKRHIRKAQILKHSIDGRCSSTQFKPTSLLGYVASRPSTHAGGSSRHAGGPSPCTEDPALTVEPQNIAVPLVLITQRLLTGPGAVLGNLLAGLVTPVDPDAEETQDGPEDNAEDDESDDEPRLVDQRRRRLAGLFT